MLSLCAVLDGAVLGFASGAVRPYFTLMADHSFRLNNTPLGTLLVKFYRVEPFTPEAFHRRLAADFLAATVPGNGGWRLSLFQGLVDDATVLPETIWRLAERCPECNCVRIEQA